MQPRASQAYKPRQSTKPGLKALSSSTAGAVPAPSASVASYPILDAPTVAECLRSMRVSMVQEEDLKQPLAGTIQAVWAVLLHEFSGVTMDGLERPKGALVGMMPYPELLSDSVSFLMFFQHVRRLAKTAGVESFTLQDLTRPQAGRCLDAFSGVINFAKFKQGQDDLFNLLTQEGEAIQYERDQLEAEADATHQKLEQLKAQRQADVPLIEEAESRNDAIRNELLVLKKDQVALSNEVAQLADVKKAVKERINAQQTEIVNLQGDIHSARSRLVQSPDRLKRTIDDLSRTHQSEKQILANFNNKARQLSAKLEQIAVLEQELNSLIEIQKDAEDQQKQTDKATSLHTLRSNEYAKASTAETSTITRLEQLATQLANATDKLGRARDMWAEKESRFRTSIAGLREEYAGILKSRDEDETELKETEKEFARHTAEIDAYLTTNQAEANVLLAEYWKLRQHVDDYMEEMTVKLGLDRLPESSMQA